MNEIGVDNGGAKAFSYEVHCIRGDGTNTNAAMGTKAHTCEIRSLFHHLPLRREHRGGHAANGDADDHDDLDLELPEKRLHCVWADVAKIPVTCQGEDVRAMYMKQCASVGLPDWAQTPTWSLPMAWPPASQELPDYIHIRVWVFASDQGGDQKGADKLIDGDVQDSALCFKLRAWCVRHILHLMARPSAKGLNV